MVTTNTTPSLDRQTVLAGLVVAGAFARSAYRFYHRYDDEDDQESSSSCHKNKSNNAIIPSPLHTLIPRLSPLEAANLPYPPYNALPGQRDVETPYGNIRVYEWGPEDGERVLLVHGISTPCIALGDLGRELVGRGKRVCLFDLFGRGYSDAPTNHTYNTQLYTTQILLVLASSPLPWLSTATFPSSTTSSSSPTRTNPLLQSPPNTTTSFSPFTSSPSPPPSASGKDKGGFHLVGYSLGSCLCVSFASHFPEKLRSLSLIAPSGQIRGYHISLQSRMLYDSGWIPEGIVRWLVGRRIRPLDAPAVEGGGVLDGDMKERTQRPGGKRNGFSNGKTGEPDELGMAEPTMINTSTTSTNTNTTTSSSSSTSLAAPPSLSPSPIARSRKKSAHSDATGGQAFDSAPLSPKHYPPHVTVSSVVRWQVDHHHGFLGAFLSTIRNAPIYQPKGAGDWSKLRDILHRNAANNGGGGSGRSSPGRNGSRNGDLLGLARRGGVLVVLGGQDSVIDRDETIEDVTAALGGECVDFEVLEGAGHEVVITQSEEVGRILGRYFDRL